jgi:hypothetical protein
MLTGFRTVKESAREYIAQRKNGEAAPPGPRACEREQKEAPSRELQEPVFNWKHDVFDTIETMVRSEPPAFRTPRISQTGIHASMKFLLRDTVDPALRQRFEELATKWREETAVTSSVAEMAMHPDYQLIIGLGPAAIPLLLGELQRQPDHWFWALYLVTGGENPVPSEDAGRIDRMAQAWLEWGRSRGYI